MTSLIVFESIDVNVEYPIYVSSHWLWTASVTQQNKKDRVRPARVMLVDHRCNHVGFLSSLFSLKDRKVFFCSLKLILLFIIDDVKQSSHLQEYTAAVRLLLVSWNTSRCRGTWAVNRNTAARSVDGHVHLFVCLWCLTFAINLPNEIVKNLDEGKEKKRSDASRRFPLPPWRSFDL